MIKDINRNKVFFNITAHENKYYRLLERQERETETEI
jgi:hypothetical protein